jgi:hypothetical protein
MKITISERYPGSNEMGHPMVDRSWTRTLKEGAGNPNSPGDVEVREHAKKCGICTLAIRDGKGNLCPEGQRVIHEAMSKYLGKRGSGADAHCSKHETFQDGCYGCAQAFWGKKSPYSVKSSYKIAAIRFRARQEAKVAGPIDWMKSQSWPTQLVLALATLLATQQGMSSLKTQVVQELQNRGQEVPAQLTPGSDKITLDPNANNYVEVEDMQGNPVPDQTEIVPDAPEPNIVPLQNVEPSGPERVDTASVKTAAPSWLEDYDRDVIPVQVVGVIDGKVTPNGHGHQEFANLAEAKTVFPTLDPDHNLGDFSWAMHGEIKGQPAMRFETWPAYRMYST